MHPTTLDLHRNENPQKHVKPARIIFTTALLKQVGFCDVLDIWQVNLVKLIIIWLAKRKTVCVRLVPCDSGRIKYGVTMGAFLCQQDLL